MELGGGSDVEPAVVTVDPESDRPADAYLSSVGEVTVRLTPLGTWWANVLLRAAGAVAPVIGEPAGTDAQAEVRSLLADPELRPSDRLRLVGRGPEDPASLDPAARKAAFNLDSPELR